MERGSKWSTRRPLLAALVAGVCLAGTAAGAEPQSRPILGVDPLTAGAEFESRVEALARWLSRGYSGAPLLHVSARDRAHPLGAEQAALARLRPTRAAQPAAAIGAEAEGGHSPLEAGFVRAAVSLGIAREVYWIVPFGDFGTPENGERLRADLRRAGFPEEELRDLALRNGCFRGTLAGAPFAACGLEALPQVAGPVLVALDTDSVMAAASSTSNPLLEMRRLLAALAARRYEVLDAVVITSVEPEATSLVPPDLRWVGETIAEALREPGLLAGSGQPKRWTLLQTLALLESVGDYAEMLHQALPYLTVYDRDPALHLYAAVSAVGRRKRDEALEHAQEACRLHRGYCYGLPWIGVALFTSGDIDGGERFFAAGERLRPGMLFGQLSRGLALQHDGRLEPALRAFLVLSDGGEPFPAAALAGALQLRAGERQGARRQFDRALEAIRSLPETDVGEPYTVQALRDGARFYREENLGAEADLLENNPRLRLPPKEVPAVSP